jgi:bifunctional non-homologous end joining protein LigD
MSPKAERLEIRVGRRVVALSSPDKVLFPEDGITKRDLFEHYVAVGPVMLPHVKGRPVTMERYPEGIHGERFYQKEAWRHAPEWMEVAELPKEKGTVRHVVLTETATLAYLAQQNTITLHVWLSKADRPHEPDHVVWDLDPATEDEFGLVRSTALRLRELLAELGLTPFVKTTGSKGLHVVLPITRGPTTPDAANFAARVGSELVRRDPERLTMEGRKEARRGRLFVDTWRNGYAQMVVAPYAVRARPGAPVATPVEWSEVEDDRLRPDTFTLRTIGERLSSTGDAWKGMARGARSIREASKRLTAIEAERGDEAGTDATDRWGHPKTLG